MNEKKIIPLEEIVPENGVLNVYARDLVFEAGADGATTMQEGPRYFVRAVGCYEEAGPAA